MVKNDNFTLLLTSTGQEWLFHINASMTQGVFPFSLNMAIVRPLLKKSGLELVESNYRPVSNLPFLSKVV